MKKVLTLGIAVLMLCMFMAGNIYAMSCKVNLQTTKSEVAKGEEFTVDLYVSDIQSERGVIALTATLDYDKTGLTLVKMEGQNGWETPAEGSAYNPQNGKIAITRSGLGKENEVIFRMTFKVNENATINPTVYLKDISITDADIPATFTEIKKEIKLKQTNSSENPLPNDPNQGSTSNNNNNNNKPNSNVPANKIPQTGVNNVPIIISIVTVAAVAIYFGIHMKLSK